MIDYRYLHKKYLLESYPDRGLVFTRGEGAELVTETGEKYLDLMSNFGVNVFGYGHPAITEALCSQVRGLANLHGSFNNDVRARAAAALVKRCGQGLARVHFSSSGAEAVEAALKFAAAVTGRRRFVACCGGYHGKTLGALSATHGERYRRSFQPLLWDFEHGEYGSLDSLRELLDDETAALIVEPIQGEAGIRVPEPGYLREAKRMCEERGALLIVDEIQTGVGRTGTFLAMEPEGTSCDILCLGKGLAGGIPIGATLVSKEVAARIPRLLHTSTFGGNPLAAAGILAVLELLDEDRLRHIQEIGSSFLAGIRGIEDENIQEVRGRGLMLAVQTAGDPTPVLRGLQSRRILAAPAGGNTVRFLPPYIMNGHHVEITLSSLKDTLAGQRNRTQAGRLKSAEPRCVAS